jgi:hypothetical protein
MAAAQPMTGDAIAKTTILTLNQFFPYSTQQQVVTQFAFFVGMKYGQVFSSLTEVGGLRGGYWGILGIICHIRSLGLNARDRSRQSAERAEANRKSAFNFTPLSRSEATLVAVQFKRLLPVRQVWRLHLCPQDWHPFITLPACRRQ